jgi:CheY-like chemotaxis protein
VVKTVLIVDDEELISASLKQRLSGTYHVWTDAAGGPALVRCRETPPDCVLVDVEMADMDGMDFIFALRRMHPRLPIVVMSGRGMFGILEPLRAAEYFVQGTLRKPFKYQQLVKVLRRVMTDGWSGQGRERGSL